MNIVMVLVALIFMLCVVDGVNRGFIKIVASLAATIVTIVVVIMLTPYVSNVLGKIIPMETLITTNCMEVLFPERDMNKAEFKEVLPKIELNREEQISLIENSKLPEVFQELILENNNSEIYDSLGVTNFGEYLVKYFAKLFINVISFLLTFLLVTIAVRTVIYMLGLISDLPVIGGINRLAGGAVGLAKALIIVWVVFVIITLMYDSKLGMTCIQCIEDSEFLSYIYDHNLLMKFMVKFRG